MCTAVYLSQLPYLTVLLNTSTKELRYYIILIHNVVAIALNMYIYYTFVGDEAGIWFVDLKNGKGATGKGEPKQPADATLTMDTQNFFAMFSGR